ncbi:MAG: TlpA family protein disulfide reductase [Verrucomicrobia bacterium]|nr:TlpA family protein disulfide reductase [Verrucomicrobiota bacterium]
MILTARGKTGLGPWVRRWAAPLLAAAVGLGVLGGCGPAGKPEAERASRVPEGMAAGDEGPLVIDAPGPGAQVAGGQGVSEADQAWLEVREASQPPEPPETWSSQRPSEDELAAFRRRVLGQMSAAADKAQSFYTRFPEHAEADEARRLEIGLLNVAAQLGDTNAAARAERREAVRLKQPGLSEDDRFELRLQQLQRGMAMGQQTNAAAMLTELEKGVRRLQAEFPKRGEMGGLLMMAAERWLEANEPAKAGALAKDALAATEDEEVQAAARDLQRKAGRWGKPLEIAYTAVDGREVDLRKLRGKVVLVDFWATWCLPCVAALPELKGTYARLQPRGFEILGISLDRDRRALERLVKAEQIPWPQCFDAATLEKSFGQEFGITSIPTVWLVDKKGVLRDLNARVDLAAKVERLLAEAE